MFNEATFQGCHSIQKLQTFTPSFNFELSNELLKNDINNAKSLTCFFSAS